MARQKNAVENQILVRDSKGINEEQVKEMKSAFDHFDKNDDGRLDHFEFRACLVSLGYNVDTEEHLVNHNVSCSPLLYFSFDFVAFLLRLSLTHLLISMISQNFLFCSCHSL